MCPRTNRPMAIRRLITPCNLYVCVVHRHAVESTELGTEGNEGCFFFTALACSSRLRLHVITNGTRSSRYTYCHDTFYLSAPLPHLHSARPLPHDHYVVFYHAFPCYMGCLLSGSRSGLPNGAVFGDGLQDPYQRTLWQKDIGSAAAKSRAGHFIAASCFADSDHRPVRDGTGRSRASYLRAPSSFA